MSVFLRKNSATLIARFTLLATALSIVPAIWCQATAGSDPQAIAIAQQSIAAIAGNPIQDATLTANATRFAGSIIETGTATLKFAAYGKSRIDLALSSGPRSEIRNGSPSDPQGQWAGPGGVAHAMAAHNCWTDPDALFPAFGYLGQANSSAILVSFIGQEKRNSVPVYHLRANVAGSKNKFAANLSSTDYFIDAVNFLPVAITFAAHPDDDLFANVSVEVRFADYRKANGVSVPFRIQQLLNGTVLLDLSIQSVALNTAISSSDFQIEVQP